MLSQLFWEEVTGGYLHLLFERVARDFNHLLIAEKVQIPCVLLAISQNLLIRDCFHHSLSLSLFLR